MSTTTNTPTDQDPQTLDPAAPPTAEGDQTSRGTRADSEAAERRRQLRDAEAERDGLRDRVATYQRREVERLAGAVLAVPADLFDIGGVQLQDLLDESGEVDETAVEAAIATVAMTRPGLRLDGGRPRSAAENGYGYQPGQGPVSGSWHHVLGRNNR